ncbi:helix-turn-helix domain-containing protein [Marinilactibacillus sp. Marseille-P9653]|uniref:helix-turn-helix domain-containing protein n=1 Tax=Marinilactibacillus sp. Marseille-P9653 TaxID=2866583 RepID=UPI001CE484A3|nr:helix-turn-helix domain-containing protein [Marinilactibacillus sp. Marseille-P9653]
MKTYPKISFEIIVPATDGDSKSIHQILKHYEGYIAKLSLRPMTDEYGNQRMMVDEELHGLLTTRLIKKILDFEID